MQMHEEEEKFMNPYAKKPTKLMQNPSLSQIAVSQNRDLYEKRLSQSQRESLHEIERKSQEVIQKQKMLENRVYYNRQ